MENLPNELIAYILSFTSFRVFFIVGSVNKRLYDLCSSNDHLWKQHALTLTGWTQADFTSMRLRNQKECIKKFIGSSLLYVLPSVNKIAVSSPQGRYLSTPDGSIKESLHSGTEPFVAFPFDYISWSPLCDKLAFSKGREIDIVRLKKPHSGFDWTKLRRKQRAIYEAWSPDGLGLSTLELTEPSLQLNLLKVDSLIGKSTADDQSYQDQGECIVRGNPCFYAYNVYNLDCFEMIVNVGSRVLMFDYYKGLFTSEILPPPPFNFVQFAPQILPQKKLLALANASSDSHLYEFNRTIYLLIMDFNKLEKLDTDKQTLSIYQQIQLPGTSASLFINNNINYTTTEKMKIIILTTRVYIYSLSSISHHHPSVPPIISITPTLDSFLNQPPSSPPIPLDTTAIMLDPNFYQTSRILLAIPSPNQQTLLTLHNTPSELRFFRTLDLTTFQYIQYETFTPCNSFEHHVLRFYEQFSTSISLFSPDSKSFVYITRKNVMVQRIGPYPPIFIGEGTSVSWSWR